MTLGREGEGLDPANAWLSDEFLAPVGGPQAQAHLESLIGAIEDRLPDFARRFAANLT